MDYCIIPECREPPSYKCLCIESDDKYCDKHAGEHIKVGENHELVPNYFEITPSKISILSIQCKSCIDKFKLANDKLLKILAENIQKITRFAMDFIKVNRTMELLYIEVLQYLSSTDRLIKKQKYSHVEDFILKHLEYPNKIISEFNMEEAKVLREVDLSKILEERHKEIDDLREKINELNTEISKLTKDFELSWEQNNKMYRSLKSLNIEGGDVEDFLQEYNSQYLYFFEDGKKNICVVDVISEKDSKIEVNITDLLTMYTGFCELPANKLFYYSGSSGNYSDICYIFDIQAKTGIKQKSHKSKLYIGSCCYLNNSVYSFGGCLPTGSPCTDSENFDLLTGEWKIIAPITTTYYSSTVSVNDMILIASYNFTNVIEYNYINNTYSSYLNGQFTSWHVVLCKGLNKIYLFSQSILWDITNYNQNKLTQIDTSTGISNSYLISNPIRHGLNIYFILSSKVIWRFNLITKKVINLRASKV